MLDDLGCELVDPVQQVPVDELPLRRERPGRLVVAAVGERLVRTLAQSAQVVHHSSDVVVGESLLRSQLEACRMVERPDVERALLEHHGLLARIRGFPRVHVMLAGHLEKPVVGGAQARSEGLGALRVARFALRPLGPGTGIFGARGKAASGRAERPPRQVREAVPGQRIAHRAEHGRRLAAKRLRDALAGWAAPEHHVEQAVQVRATGQPHR